MKPQWITKMYEADGIEDIDLLVSLILTAAEINNATDYLRALTCISSLDITVHTMTDDQRSNVKAAILESFRNEGIITRNTIEVMNKFAV
mmetsp:Transcript_21261/g.31287  ORF Transcript_21261/g.31287 Transcript_21261/m.31287 type:complete len:90 (+) Transcript_21261:1118-1387(+)